MINNTKDPFFESKREYLTNRTQYNLAKKLLENIELEGKALDLGCGMGEFSDFMAKKGLNVICVDGTPRFIDELKERGYESHKINLEEENLPFNNEFFDLVVSLDVIEYLWNVDHYLSEIKRVIKPEGHVIFTTINYNAYIYRQKHLFGNFENFTYKSRHKKFYTYKSFKKN